MPHPHGSLSRFAKLCLGAVSASALLSVSAQAENIRFPADAGVIDVTDPFFGAVPGDGIDDTDAIQKVFDLLTPSGRIVYFPAGRYDISRELKLKKNPFRAEAEAIATEGGIVETADGARTFVSAEFDSEDPETAPRLVFDFEAIAASRTLRVDYRVAIGKQGRFAWRINGGDWVFGNQAAFQGQGLQEGGVLGRGVEMVTGDNTLEIALLSSGLEVDRVAVDYLGAYLANTIIQGESRDRTQLRLADNLRDEDGGLYSGAILSWEEGVEQFFRTAVRNIGFDVGRNNPEADGLRFHGSNQSTISDVKFRAERTSGDVALDMVHSAGIGPILVRNVRIEGFDIGIHTGWQNGSRTFDTIGLFGQREFGWVNEAASQVFIRKLISHGSVPAFVNRGLRLPGDGNGRVVMIDSLLRGRGAASEVPAIETRGLMYISNTRTPGYDTAIFNRDQRAFRGGLGQDGIDGEFIGEWWSDGAFNNDGGGFTRLFEDTPDTALRLSPAFTPNIIHDDIDTWRGPQHFVLENPDGSVSGVPNDGRDDTASLQAAIDSGAGTVYLPQGQWTLDGTVELRGNVHRLVGTEGGLWASNFNLEPSIVIGPEGPKTVRIERLANFGFTGTVPEFEHASKRTVVFSSVTGLNYTPTVDKPGNVFIEDAVGDAIRFQGGQSVWARQLNIEEQTTDPGADRSARIVNDGARVWVLGFKTEQRGVHVKTTNGGITEILGNHQLNTFGNGTPQYITEDGTLTVVSNFLVNSEPGTTYGTVVETRDGETRTGRIEGTGYVAMTDQALWDIKNEILIDDAESGVSYQGEWFTASSFPRGHIGDGFHVTPRDNTGASATYTADIPRTGRYEVAARWVGDWPGQTHTGHAVAASYAVTHRDGTDTVTVDQRDYSDGWFPLGTYGFEAGDTAEVTLSGNGGGRLVTDGIRLRRIR